MVWRLRLTKLLVLVSISGAFMIRSVDCGLMSSEDLRSAIHFWTLLLKIDVDFRNCGGKALISWSASRIEIDC